MALKGLDIFKLTPKKNCKECGSPTCMAFSMKVAQGAGYERSRGAAGDHSGDIVLVAKHNHRLYHRGVSLEADGVGGLLVASDDLRGVDDLEPRRVV